MCGGCEAKQADRLAHRVREGYAHHGNGTESTDQHGEAARGAQRMPASHGRCGEPSSGNAAYGCANVHEDERKAELIHVDQKSFVEVFGKPEKIKPPHWISKCFGAGKCPRGAA